MARLAEVDVLFRGRTRGFNKALRKSEKRVKRFSRVAKTSIKVVSAAFAAAGAAGTKFAADFEKSTTRLETLVGLSADQVSRMRQEILQLAPAVGKGPKELSDALFAITSAGLRGEEALTLLEQAAKASVIGLGDMTAIARTATAAVNAFGDAGLTTKEAVDQLVVTVRQGNLRAEELAGSLSKVFGIASQLGISFEQVNTFIATFTRLGANARVASTALRQVLANIIKPSEQAREAFKDAGTSIEEFREEIQEKGLTKALIDLVEAQEGNLDALGQLIPNIRGLAGVLSTAGSQADDFEEIWRNLQDATGATNEAFKKANRTLSQLTNRVLRSAQVGLIRIAREFFPEIKSFARFLRKQMPKAFAAFIRGVRSMVRAAIVAGVEFAESPMGKLMGMDVPEGTAQTLSRLRDVRGEIEDLAQKAETAFLAAESGAGKLAEDAFFRLFDRIQELREEARQLENELAGGVLGRLDELEDRLLSGIADGASDAAANVEELRKQLRDIVMTMTGPFQNLFERIFGVVPGGTPALADLPSLEGRIEGRKRMMRSFQRLEEMAGGPISVQQIANANSTLGKLNNSSRRLATTIISNVVPAFGRLITAGGNLASRILGTAAAIARAIAQIQTAQAAQAAGSMTSMAGIGAAGGLAAAGGPIGIAAAGLAALASFAGFFQHGGTIPGGQFGIVGEDGPELVSGPAEVSPLAGAGAGMVMVDASDLRPETRASMAQDPVFGRRLEDARQAGRLMGRD